MYLTNYTQQIEVIELALNKGGGAPGVQGAGPLGSDQIQIVGIFQRYHISYEVE